LPINGNHQRAAPMTGSASNYVRCWRRSCYIPALRSC